MCAKSPCSPEESEQMSATSTGERALGGARARPGLGDAPRGVAAGPALGLAPAPRNPDPSPGPI
eukprot:5231399-Prymnesium_polylepis.1